MKHTILGIVLLLSGQSAFSNERKVFEYSCEVNHHFGELVAGEEVETFQFSFSTKVKNPNKRNVQTFSKKLEKFGKELKISIQDMEFDCDKTPGNTCEDLPDSKGMFVLKIQTSEQLYNSLEVDIRSISSNFMNGQKLIYGRMEVDLEEVSPKVNVAIHCNRK